MARALALHAGGRGFESPTVHKGVKAHKDVQSLDGERLGFESQIFHNKRRVILNGDRARLLSEASG